MDELPDSIVLQILKYLGHVDICQLAQTCQKLCRVADDEILWRNLFLRQFRIDPGVYLEPLVAETWKGEFIRLINETPMMEVEVLTKHTDQVLHVSFSHDGQRFATTAKDGYVTVWKNGHPVEMEHSKNMKQFSWKYTQYSQFNESDTLLLVSGVLFGLHSTSGEIAVFSLKEGFQLQCRTMSKPYDIFGTWYSDMFFFSGNLQWLGNMVSKSVIWINKASQESDSEHTAIMNELYKFYNSKASSVRSLMIANCVQDDGISCGINEEQISSQPVAGSSNSCRDTHTGNPLSNLPLEQDLMRINSRGHRGTLQGAFQNWRPLDNIADINYSDAFRKRGRSRASRNETGSDAGSAGGKILRVGRDEESASSSMEDLISDDGNRSPDQESSESASSPDDDRGRKEDQVLDTREKWLIFTCGSETYTPHQIGFKRIQPMTFNGRLDPGPSVKERIQEYKRRRQMELAGVDEPDINWQDYPAVADRFDKIDHIVDLHGHIIGMTLSPDHRYLYVNSRPWPEGYKITDPLEPPPIASEIDIHVIDLKTITQVGMMRRAHRAYTPNEECFFIFLDACDQYVASGAEDKHGYVWDRHYGISLIKLPHTDVVNSVAFNPIDSQMLVSVSDDYSIKVWRSRGACRELGLDLSSLNQGTKLYCRRKPVPSAPAGSTSSAAAACAGLRLPV